MEEILPFMTTWMNLESIMLNEINQTQNNALWSHLYMESKNVKLIETESGMMLSRGWGLEEMARCRSKGTDFRR